ncbi:MAG: Tellurite resistance protein TerB [Cyanobacteria bacterium RYN_339]|nr:Tellurite resistance protein TerB [Cyanobacteria bacterium RYN_339]
MYLDLLEDFEKIAFSRLAFKMIAFTGIDEHEEKLYYAALAEMGIGEPDLDEEVDIHVECEAFRSEDSRRIAMVELMLLALADGDLGEDEQSLLDEIIGAFGFDSATLEQAWTWVYGWYQTFRTGKDFIKFGVLTAHA